MGILTALAEVKTSFQSTFGSESYKRKQHAIAEKIIVEGRKTSGTITAVKTCWWIKINTKPARRHTLDGAKFPHIIYFTYRVNGHTYQGSKCVSFYIPCPGMNETITVFYEKGDPTRTAVSLGDDLPLY